METLEETEIETKPLLQVSIYQRWYAADFKTLFQTLTEVFSLLENVNNIRRKPEIINKISEWTKLKFSLSKTLSSDDDLGSALTRLSSSNISNLGFHMKEVKSLLNNKRYFTLLDNQVNQLFAPKKNAVKILKINYNSPGDIIAEASTGVLKQGNDILNSLLFYSKRKKQLELEIQTKEFELDEKMKDAANKERVNAMTLLQEDLKNQISLIRLFNELKKELISFGRSEQEAELFIHQYLIDNLDTIFPAFAKIDEIKIVRDSDRRIA